MSRKSPPINSEAKERDSTMPTRRKVVSMQTKHMAKSERMQRELAEEQYKMGRDHLRPPEWMDDEGKAEFNRIVEETGKVGMLDNGDFAVLMIYADNYARYCQAARGEFDKANDKLRDMAAKSILQCSARLGLTITDRLRLTVPKEKAQAENKYLKYLKE